MSVKKLLTSSLRNPQWYRSMSAKTNAPAPFSLHYLIIGGGGGGGGKNQGGGGGAGGYRTSFGTSGGGSSAEAVLSASTLIGYTVTVGAGGAAGVFEMQGTNGSNSVFGTLTSFGGGGGGNYGDKNGLAGGSGGGASLASSGGAGTPGQGYRGGNMSGGGGSNYPFTWQCAGGGGAGGQGADQGRSGGSGVASTITGTSVTRAGGGGGAGSPSIGGDGGSGGGGNGASMGQPYSGPERNATPGATNTGSGGGGGGKYQNESEAGAGGSGIVIVRYPDNFFISSATGLTHSTVNSGGFNITTFTAGTGNLIFSQVESAPYAYELIETVRLTSPQTSVTFNVSGLGSEYKHLQIRSTVRTTRSNTADFVKFTFNADTTGYARHALYGNGSTATSYGLTDIISSPDIPGGSATANQFGAFVMDILEPFETTKNKTTRSLGGATGSVNRIQLDSGLWIDTNAITSIKLESGNAGEGASLATGTRISLYGIKVS